MPGKDPALFRTRRHRHAMGIAGCWIALVAGGTAVAQMRANTSIQRALSAPSSTPSIGSNASSAGARSGMGAYSGPVFQGGAAPVYGGGAAGAFASPASVSTKASGPLSEATNSVTYGSRLGVSTTSRVGTRRGGGQSGIPFDNIPQDRRDLLDQRANAYNRR